MQYTNIITLKISIDSVVGNFIFDTVSPLLVLDTLFYKNIPKKYKTQSIEIGGIGEKTQEANLIVDTLKFNIADKITSYSNKTLLIGLKNIAGKNFDGLLGIDTFKENSFKIIYPENRIELTNNFDGFKEIEARLINDRIYIMVEIELQNGQKEKGFFLVDTGSATSTINNIPHLVNQTTLDAASQKFYSLGGSGGESNGYRILAKKIILGSYSLKKKPIEISIDKAGTYANKEYSGVIGNDVLEHFDVIINRKKSSLFLKPNSHFKNRKYEDLNIDFDVLDRTDLYKSWVVNIIYENSDAYKKGIRLNDRIIKIDTIDVFNLNFSTWLRTIKKNQKVTVSFISSDNVVKTVEVELKKMIKK